MNFNELKPKIDTADKNLERYTDFKKRYYIYRADDIIDYLQNHNTELNKLYQQEDNMYNDLKENLSPSQQQLLLRYSDNWIDLVNEKIKGLTKYMLIDFEEER